MSIVVFMSTAAVIGCDAAFEFAQKGKTCVLSSFKVGNTMDEPPVVVRRT